MLWPLLFYRFYYIMYIWYNSIMIILHLYHWQTLYPIGWLTLSGLTECIINEWMNKHRQWFFLKCGQVEIFESDTNIWKWHAGKSWQQMKFSKFLLLFSPESSVFPFTAQNYMELQFCQLVYVGVNSSTASLTLWRRNFFF